MAQNPHPRPRRAPVWLYLLLAAAAAGAAGVIWLVHPRDWVEVGNIVLAGLVLEVVGLVLALPIGLITGAYRKHPHDYGAPRPRPFGFVAVVMIGAIGGLYLLGSNVAWFPAMSSREIWRYAPWDPRWTSFWVKQGLWTAAYAALFLASAAVQGLWDNLEHRRRRRAAELRRAPVSLEGV